jgi:ADP-heptose:LPS heptosyltransferase
MFYALKKKYPESHFTFVRSPTNYNIDYKTLFPFLDEVLTIEEKSLKYQWNFVKLLRKRKFDIGIVPSTTIELSTTSHVMNFLSGAKLRVGLSYRDGIKNPFGFLLNIKKSFDWNKRKVCQADRCLEIVNQIGCDLTEEEINNIGIELQPEHYDFADDFINKKLGSVKTLIGVHPGSNKPETRWAIEYYAELIEALDKKYNAGFFISSGAVDKEIVSKLSEILKEKNIKFVVENSPGVKYSSALMRKLDLLVSNDTGALHLASLNKVNSIGLYGPEDSFIWRPIWKNTVCLQSPTNNINDLKTETVLELVNKLLNRK